MIYFILLVIGGKDAHGMAILAYDQEKGHIRQMAPHRYRFRLEFKGYESQHGVEMLKLFYTVGYNTPTDWDGVLI